MAVAKLLNGRQCAKARELLSWNIHDLAHQTNLPPKVIEQFERGREQLLRYQNVKVREVFEAADIVFSEHMDVTLKKKKTNQGVDRFVQMDEHVKTKEEADNALKRVLKQAQE